MGTRSIIQIKLEGKIYLQQYNQWDGSPAYLGKDICNFIIKWFGFSPKKTSANYKLFIKHLRNSRMVSETEYAKLMGEHEALLNKSSKAQLMQAANYQLTRDCAELVFWYIIFTEKPILAVKFDMNDFAFRYVLDLDKFTLTIFHGRKKMGSYALKDLSRHEMDLLEAEYEGRKVKRKVKGTIIELHPTYVVVALKGKGMAVCHGSRLGGNAWGYGYEGYGYESWKLESAVEVDIVTAGDDLLVEVLFEKVEWEILNLKSLEIVASFDCRS